MKKLCLSAASVLMMAVGVASAQLEAVAGSLDQAEVLREIEPQPEPYAINSAITLTNPHGEPSAFKIELFDNTGARIGGGSVVVPPRGLEVVWVSTLLEEEGRRFVGWGVARSERPLRCNAFLVGIGTSPLPVEKQRLRNSDARAVRKLFPVLAAL